MFTIVLDSNIFVSAFLTPAGESEEVFRRARQHGLCVSSFILDEVEKTLHAPRIRKKYHYPDTAIDRHLNNIRIFSMRVEPTQILNVCLDSKDNAILACAMEAQADYLVTRNIKDFPSTYASVSIVIPQIFLSLTKP